MHSTVNKFAKWSTLHQTLTQLAFKPFLIEGCDVTRRMRKESELNAHCVPSVKAFFG